MAKTLTYFGILVVIGLFIAAFAYGGDTSSVAATVTAQNISVSVTDGAVGYGTLSVSGTSSTLNAEANDEQTATNNGSGTENFNIKGANTGAWTLAATQGSEQYFHKFCNNGTCDASPVWTALTTNYQTLGTSIATSGTKLFDLQIGVPSSTATYTQQTANVIVQAVAG